jgi:hypothetical protein
MSTFEAEVRLGVTAWTLNNLIRSRKMAAPAKDRYGNFVWTDEDIERARHALTLRRSHRVAARNAGGVMQAS